MPLLVELLAPVLINLKVQWLANELQAVRVHNFVLRGKLPRNVCEMIGECAAYCTHVAGGRAVSFKPPRVLLPLLWARGQL